MDTLRRTWAWFLILGLISILGGILAFAYPYAASLAVVYWAAWAFLIVGVGQVVHAFMIRAWGGFVETVLMGVIALLLGICLLANPLAGVMSLSLLVAVLFLLYGLTKATIALRMRPHGNWGWMLVSALLSILLAVMIASNFPWSAAALLGALLGIELVSNGLALLLIGLALRSAGKRDF